MHQNHPNASKLPKWNQNPNKCIYDKILKWNQNQISYKEGGTTLVWYIWQGEGVGFGQGWWCWETWDCICHPTMCEYKLM